MLHSANIEEEKVIGSMDGVTKSKINIDMSISVLLYNSAQVCT
jgi:hypothetical protein